MVDSTSDMARALREQAAAQLAEASRLEAAAAEAERAAREALKPKEPDLLGGPVFVTFTKYQSGRLYTYAAVGWLVLPGDVAQGRRSLQYNTGRWSVTGREAERYNWPGLLDFVGEANWPTLTLLTLGDALIAADAAPPVVEKLGRFGRVLASETPTGGDPLGYGRSRFADGGIVKGYPR